MSKLALNISNATFVWPDKLSTWKQASPLTDDVKVQGTEFPDFWFYITDYSQELKQLEVRCIDSSHLLTRTCLKICKGGIENLTNKPWIKVAKTKKHC